jgi:hypothetical protein
MLGAAAAPLNDLAIKYVSKGFATAIDLAAVISAFSCVIGAVSAATASCLPLAEPGWHSASVRWMPLAVHPARR